MKTNLTLLLVLFALFLVSCRKDDKIEDPELNSNFVQHNADRNFLHDEADQADGDINEALKDIPGFGKTAGVTSVGPLCGVTIEDSLLSQKILFFNFDGVTPCFSPSRTRSGQIKVELTEGNSWSDLNAELTLTYINFKVTRLSDSKWIMFNGQKIITNLNGHDWISFFSNPNFKHEYKARAFGVNVTFNNGASALWNGARKTSWSYAPPSAGGPKYNFTSIGDTSLNGYSNVDMWGVNRFGESFTTYYDAAWQSNSYCGFWRPTAGVINHDVGSRQYKIELGVDQSGNPSTLNCAYGYKVTWIMNGNSISRVFSY
ncbi:MAG: hypothetical protein ACK5C5_10060 [Bacteroidota bacterium]|jgi:hypothetical protein